MIIDFGYGESSHGKGHIGWGVLFFEPGDYIAVATRIGAQYVEPGQGVQSPPTMWHLSTGKG